MFSKAKEKIESIREERRRKKEEQEQIRRQRAEEQERLERERIQAEKDELMQLSEKELMVEIIMLLRAGNRKLGELDERAWSMERNLELIESNVSSIRWSADS